MTDEQITSRLSKAGMEAVRVSNDCWWVRRAGQRMDRVNRGVYIMHRSMLHQGPRMVRYVQQHLMVGY